MNNSPLITIRRMQSEDTETVAKIEAAAFSEPWPQQEFLKACDNANYLYLTALDKETVVGYAGATIVLDEADITNIAVEEGYRQLGIGEKLLLLLTEEAKKRGAARMFLEVRVSNGAAIGLYEKLGFSRVGLRKKFYRRPEEDAHIMMKELNGLDIC